MSGNAGRTLGRGRTGFLMGVLVMLSVAVGPAAALTPPMPEKAGIVFSNGGRIVSIKADGSERTVLTNRSRPPRNGPYGHTDPKVSPDGGMMLFTDVRRVDERSEPRVDLMLSRADGSEQKRLLVSRGRFRYSDAAWMPDGSILAPYYELAGKRRKAGLLKIQPDGSGRQTVFKMKTRRALAWPPPQMLTHPEVSPDGRKAMVGIREGYSAYGMDDGPGPLVIVDLSTGHRKLISEDAFSGGWSPDGSRLVYAKISADNDDYTCSWQFSCSRSSRLVVADGDGGSPRRLLRGKDDQRSPKWSPDGSRVLFQSNRNLPGASESFELYSVKSDGSCLTWLTNGTPASVAPSWIPGEGVSSDPGGCDPLTLTSLAEVPLPKTKPQHRWTPLWTGESRGPLLHSGGFSNRLGMEADYMDCDRFDPKQCRRPFILFSVDTCSVSGSLHNALGGDRLVRKQRGVPVFRSKAELGWITVAFTGRSYVMILGGSKWARKEIGALRPVGQARSAGLLPKPLFPARDLRRMKKIVRVVKRSGSVRAAAKRLGRRPGGIRANLRLSRELGRISRYGAVNCPKGQGRRTNSGSSVDEDVTVAGSVSGLFR